MKEGMESDSIRELYRENFINARTDKPLNGLAAQVNKELCVLQGGVCFAVEWLNNQVSDLIRQLDFASINQASALDRDLIGETISNN